MSRRHHRLHAPERFHERGEIGKVRHREEVQEPEIDASEKRKEGVGAKRGERVEEEEEEEFFRDCSFRFFVDFEDFEKARHRASRELAIKKSAPSSSTKATKKSRSHSKTKVVVDEYEQLSEDIVETIVEDIAEDVIVPTSNAWRELSTGTNPRLEVDPFEERCNRFRRSRTGCFRTLQRTRRNQRRSLV